MKTYACLTIDLDSINQNSIFDINNLNFDYKKELKLFCKNLSNCTLFPRIDKQVSENYSKDFVYEIALNVHKNPEIGWHPHVYQKLENQIKQVTSEKEIVQFLNELYEDPLINKMKIFRMGNCQGGNQIYKWLDGKFDISSSSMSGCCRQDEIRYYNWSETSNVPYHPSIKNYMIEDKLNHKILEIPLTTIFIKTCYDKNPKKRVINLSYRKEIFEYHIKLSISELKKIPIIIISCHAEEFIKGHFNDLYEYGIDNCLYNLDFFNKLFKPQYIDLKQFNQKFKLE